MSHGKTHVFRISALMLAVVAAIALALPGIAWADNSSKQNATTTSSLSASSIKSTREETSSVGVSYRVKFSKDGWSAWATDNGIAGKPSKHRRAKAFQIALAAGTYQGYIQYRVRLKNGKWKPWTNGDVPTKTSKNVEAIQIRLRGDISKKYDVVYRVYVQDLGWQRRMRNCETAGTKGSGQRIEALRVQLVSKKRKDGWVKSNDGNWSFYRSGKKVTSTWLDTDESPIDVTYAGKHRYWLDSRGILAVDRFVNPNASYDAAAGHAAFASLSGYVLCGKFDLGSGILLADNTTGELYAKTRWLTTDQFDGSEQRYRLVKRGFYAVVKTGAFTVKGKRYYAYEDGRGYVMRNNVWWVDGMWKKASKKGVLKEYTGTSKIIENYVNWAVAIANDDSHGYSQAVRWGPDYDCSSFVCSSLLAAGFPNSGASWTGNMKSCLKKIGFKWHKGTKGLKRGDIMFVHNSAHQHTEIYLGKKKLVGAHSSENGGIYGAAGDQTGREISVTGYYNMPWQGYFRYKA